MTGEDIINALLKPLGTNLNNYERRWHVEAIQAADKMAEERAVLVDALTRLLLQCDVTGVGEKFPTACDAARKALIKAGAA